MKENLRYGHTLGFVPPAKPARVVPVPVSSTMGWLRRAAAEDEGAAASLPLLSLMLLSGDERKAPRLRWRESRPSYHQEWASQMWPQPSRQCNEPGPYLVWYRHEMLQQVNVPLLFIFVCFSLSKLSWSVRHPSPQKYPPFYPPLISFTLIF